LWWSEEGDVYLSLCDDNDGDGDENDGDHGGDGSDDDDNDDGGGGGDDDDDITDLKVRWTATWRIVTVAAWGGTTLTWREKQTLSFSGGDFRRLFKVY